MMFIKKLKIINLSFIALVLLSQITLSSCSEEVSDNDLPAGYRSYNKEIDALIGQMTLSEKIVQLSSSFPNANERLGIPQMATGEALSGVCMSRATSFTQAIGLGATFDPKLIEEMGVLIGKEGRAYGYHQVYSPTLSLARDPRWGRVEETYGEDPYLAARMGVAYINGVQGVGEERYGPEKMMCTPKHYVGEGITLRGGNGAPMDVTEPTFRETDLVPFEAAVKEAKVGSMMGASNSVNRVPIHVNKWLMKDILRDEWGFDGMLMSDNVDLVKTHYLNDVEGHYFASSSLDAARRALEAGVDQELAMGFAWDSRLRTYGDILVKGVENGEVPEALIDQALRNVLRAKYRLGLFEDTTLMHSDFLKGVDLGDIEDEAIDHWAVAISKDMDLKTYKLEKDNRAEICETQENDDLALKIAEKAIVLLKNEANILPLNKSDYKSIAVIGPNADDMVKGNYKAWPRHWVTILDGIRNYVGKGTKVTYAKGCGLNEEATDDIPAAVKIAKSADLSIVVVGTSQRTMGENKDRSVLELTGRQRELVRAVHATGKPVVVVLINGGALAIPWIKENIPAVVEGWYSGQESGTAIANVLFGDVNPGGKLPITFPHSTGMIPCYYNHLPSGGPLKYNEGPYRVCYPFGYGLSYTTFDLSAPVLDKVEMSKDETATLKVKVSNTGSRSGDEVVQVYVTKQFATLVQPVLELKAFKRVTLEAGETQNLEFEVGFEELKSWMKDKWDVESGEFIISVGNDSENLQKVKLVVK